MIIYTNMPPFKILLRMPCMETPEDGPVAARVYSIFLTGMDSHVNYEQNND